MWLSHSQRMMSNVFLVYVSVELAPQDTVVWKKSCVTSESRSLARLLCWCALGSADLPGLSLMLSWGRAGVGLPQYHSTLLYVSRNTPTEQWRRVLREEGRQILCFYKCLPASGLQLSHWPRQVRWPSPESVHEVTTKVTGRSAKLGLLMP